MSGKRRKKVLAIDDEPSMTEWLKMVLEQAGYEVRTALIGARGEELFKTWRPDAVLTDMMLPDIDGIQLVRRFQRYQRPGRSHRHQRAGQHPARGRGRQGGRVHVPPEAHRRRGHPGDARKGHRAHRPASENQQLKQKLEDRFKLGQHHRPQQADAGPLRAGRERGGQRGEHPHPGRERNRQGADRERPPLQQQAVEGTVHQDQLRRHPEGPDRVGALRLQEGRVHRRDDRQGGPLRDGGGRLAAARRDWRDAVVPADQAAAGAAGAGVPPHRQRPDRARGLPPGVRDQHRSRRWRCARASCARISTSASTRSRCGCRRSGSGPRTFRSCATTSSRSSGSGIRRT